MKSKIQLQKASAYSSTPLQKKLGISGCKRACLIKAPAHFLDVLGPFPSSVLLQPSPHDCDYIHVFVNNIDGLQQILEALRDDMLRSGMLWVSWFKKSSKLPTELSEDIIRNCALAIGLVDIKVCAIDDDWSGLKFVWRRELR